jgi:transcriptional antiterminator RfaH
MSFREFIDDDSGEMGEHGFTPWHLAYTRPRMEEAAVFNLERQGFETYLPMLKICKQTPQGLQAVFETMFPRYVFLRQSSERQSLSKVTSTRGVSSLIRVGLEPAQVRPEILQELRAFERSRNKAGLEAINPIQPGARVRVRKGGLKSLEGLVISVARQRVTFLLELLGREKQVTVEHGELELA